MMKVMTLFVLLIGTVVGARSCSSSSPSSPFNPSNVARNGLAGVCANQQAVDAAGGASPGGGSTIPQSMSQSVQQELGGLAGSAVASVSCTTTTLATTGDGN